MLDTVVVGGGLAGLVAATLLARAGQRVELLERGRTPGGRARSRRRGGGVLNLGPHALYARGRARRGLEALGVRWTGRKPPLGGLAIWQGEAHALPLTPWSWATTTLFGRQERAEMARWLVRLGATSAAAWRGRPLAELLHEVQHPVVNHTLRAFVRVTTYCPDPTRVDAGAVLDQLQLALWSVYYVDGGWQALVDGAVEAAGAAGVRIRTGAAVERVSCGRVHTGASTLEAGAVVLAVAPKIAAELTGSPALGAHVADLTPVRAACLDLVLRELPCPDARFALGIDRPTYLSVHSGIANLGEGTVVHALRYGAGRGAEAELEGMMDQVQPGWREHILHRRFLPSLVVCEATPAGSAVPSEVPGLPGVLVAGDWVGGEGMLLDRAVASAEAAADRVLTLARARAA